MKKLMGSFVAIAALALTACGDTPHENRAEELQEARSEARGEDWLSEEIHEGMARERAELADDVGASPRALADEPAPTAAEVVDAREEGIERDPGDAY
ncbi:MAG: hypothetical protein M3Y87_04160 [Myxococcota bacterium]|nr:hypothetical protein [Myxococcota bacterium]